MPGRSAVESGPRHCVNLEENLSSPQRTHMVEVSGNDYWQGSPHNISSFLVCTPVMGPYAQVYVYNRAPVKRTVSVWG